MGVGSLRTRSNDTDFDFHQDPNFWYLTGFHEPEAVAVLTPGHSEGDYTLFVRPRDPEMEAEVLNEIEIPPDQFAAIVRYRL